MDALFNVVLVETKNTCTRHCWFCKFGQDRQDPAQSEMDWRTIDRIVQNLGELDYAGRISWFWINEPLMDVRMPDILKLTRRRVPRAFLSLLTNGDLLDAALYQDLIDAGLDTLGVSVYDDATMPRIEAIKDDRLSVLDMRYVLPGRVENRGGNIKQHDRIFEAFRSQYATRSCGRPFNMLTINPHGQVVLCCSDLYSSVVMGDVHEQRLEEIWQNPQFTHYRSTLNTRGRHGLKLCESCSFPGHTSEVFFPSNTSHAESLTGE